MARPLRIQYPDAWYHVMNRGRRRESVFKKKEDYLAFRLYGVREEDLLVSKRGMSNEARNVVIYLHRQLRGSKLEEIGEEYGIGSCSTVSTIIERTKKEVIKNRRLRRRIEQVRHELEMSQEQT